MAVLMPTSSPRASTGSSTQTRAYARTIAGLGLQPSQVAFVGDDLVDLPIMLRVGFAVAVQDGHAMVKKHAHWTTPSEGGRGAARDLCELIMLAQGTHAPEMQRYL